MPTVKEEFLTKPFDAQWKEAMDWWKNSGMLEKGIRNVAMKRLWGAEEIGTSDLNHSVFSLYREYLSCGKPPLLRFLMDRIM